MNSKNIVAIKDEKIKCTCMKCLKECNENDIHMIHIPEMGYGSGFDGFDTILFLCDECYKKSIEKIPDLWKMYLKKYTVHYKKNDNLSNEERQKAKEEQGITVPKDETSIPIDMQNDIIYTCDFDLTYEEYKYENEMFDYIDNLPIQSRELVYNRLANGHRDRRHNPQDYIDYELGELSYEKCKENYWVFEGEYEAYKEKYEKCDHVVNVVCHDGSKGSHCLINKIVHGKFGGVCEVGGKGCYKCDYFKERTGDLRTVKE